MIKRYRFKPEPEFHFSSNESIAIPFRSHPEGLVPFHINDSLLEMNTYKTPFYGVELEVEVDENKIFGMKIEAIIWKVMSLINNMGFYIKTDSSLRNGLELVSHPRTYNNWLSRQRDMRGLFNALLKRGITGATPRCGYHVHIGHDSWMSVSHYAKFVKILYEFQPLLLGKERENLDRIRQYCAPIQDWRDIVDVFILKTANNTDFEKYFNATYTRDTIDERVHHHTAITVTKNTTEIRLFRGTTTTLKFYKVLALLEAIRIYTATHGFGKATKRDFGLWLSTQKNKDFKVAFAYINGQRFNKNVFVSIHQELRYTEIKRKERDQLKELIKFNIDIDKKFISSPLADKIWGSNLASYDEYVPLPTRLIGEIGILQQYTTTLSYNLGTPLYANTFPLIATDYEEYKEYKTKCLNNMFIEMSKVQTDIPILVPIKKVTDAIQNNAYSPYDAIWRFSYSLYNGDFTLRKSETASSLFKRINNGSVPFGDAPSEVNLDKEEWMKLNEASLEVLLWWMSNANIIKNDIRLLSSLTFPLISDMEITAENLKEFCVEIQRMIERRTIYLDDLLNDKSLVKWQLSKIRAIWEIEAGRHNKKVIVDAFDIPIIDADKVLAMIGVATFTKCYMIDKTRYQRDVNASSWYAYHINRLRSVNSSYPDSIREIFKLDDISIPNKLSMRGCIPKIIGWPTIWADRYLSYRKQYPTRSDKSILEMLSMNSFRTQSFNDEQDEQPQGIRIHRDDFLEEPEENNDEEEIA